MAEKKDVAALAASLTPAQRAQLAKNLEPSRKVVTPPEETPEEKEARENAASSLLKKLGGGGAQSEAVTVCIEWLKANDEPVTVRALIDALCARGVTAQELRVLLAREPIK